MSKSLFTGQSFGGVHFEKTDHELQGFLGQACHVTLLKSLRLSDVWKLEADKPWVLVEALHLLLGQWAEDFLDQVKLVHFAVTWKQRLAVAQLAHDAAYCPHVNFWAVVRIAEQQFGRSIPPGGHIVCHLATFQPWTSEILRKWPGKAEIANFERVIIPEKLGFECLTD
jgi:hypothetical protein